MKKQIVITVLKYGLGLGLLAWVVWRYWGSTEYGPGLGDALDKAMTGNPPANYLALLLAAVTYLVGLLITFYRWYVLVRAQRLPFAAVDAMRLGLIGFYLSTFLPGSVGGDIIKAAFIARSQSRRTVAVATVIVDRFIGLCGLFWLVTVVGGAAWLGGFMQQVTSDASAREYLEMIILSAIGLTVASFAVWFAAGFVSDASAEGFAGGLQRIPKLGGPLAELWRALHMYRQNGKSVVFTLLMSMVGHIGFVLAFYFAAMTLTSAEEIPTLAAHFVIVPVGMTFAAGFPSPGGVGGAELGFGKLYEMAGFSIAAGVLGSLVQRVITWTLGLIGYLVYLRMKPALSSVPRISVPVDAMKNHDAEQTAPTH